MPIPEELELGRFHELRNPIQHIGEYVDKTAVASLLGNTIVPFLERFTVEQLGIKLEEVFSASSLSALQSIKLTHKTPTDELIEKLANFHPEVADALRHAGDLAEEGAIEAAGLIAGRELERHLILLLAKNGTPEMDLRRLSILPLIQEARRQNIISDDEMEQLNEVRQLRNYFAHPRPFEEDKLGLKDAKLIIENVTDFLNKHPLKYCVASIHVVVMIEFAQQIINTTKKSVLDQGRSFSLCM